MAGLTGMMEVRDKSEEEEIIASIRAGSTHLFHDLIRPYERKVYAMAQMRATSTDGEIGRAHV